MSEQVKRYVTTCDCMSEAAWGDYVRHSDYEALRTELDNCQRAWGFQRSEIDALLREKEQLRVQVSALQSDANSWQSGYDKGREDGAKAAEGWKAQHARDSAELRKLCAERDALAAELASIKSLVEALQWCEDWFVKHCPTSKVDGFFPIVHPMLTSIRNALAAHRQEQPQ